MNDEHTNNCIRTHLGNVDTNRKFDKDEYYMKKFDLSVIVYSVIGIKLNKKNQIEYKTSSHGSHILLLLLFRNLSYTIHFYLKKKKGNIFLQKPCQY